MMKLNKFNVAISNLKFKQSMSNLCFAGYAIYVLLFTFLTITFYFCNCFNTFTYIILAYLTLCYDFCFIGWLCYGNY